MSIMIIQSLLWVVNVYNGYSEFTMGCECIQCVIWWDTSCARWGVRIVSGCLSRTMSAIGGHFRQLYSDCRAESRVVNHSASVSLTQPHSASVSLTQPQSTVNIQDYFIISFEKLERGWTLINISRQ